jgi:hypothetical protein
MRSVSIAYTYSKVKQKPFIFQRIREREKMERVYEVKGKTVKIKFEHENGVIYFHIIPSDPTLTRYYIHENEIELGIKARDILDFISSLLEKVERD